MRKNKFLAGLLVVALFVTMFSGGMATSFAAEVTQENGVLSDLNQALAANEQTDSENPVITVEGLRHNQEVTESELSFTVTVTDDVYKDIIPEVTLNGVKVSTVDEEYTVFLQAGENLIAVTATDGAGKRDEEAFTVIYQKSPVTPAISYKEQLDKNLAYIVQTVNNPTFGTGGGEWSILSLARAGYKVPDGYYDLYYNNVVEQVQELMPQYAGKLHRNKGTEHSRLILGFASIGQDFHDVAGYDIRNALADYNYVIRQGINGPIFALIAFDSNNYDIPQVDGVAEQTTRDKLIAYILDKEIKKGTVEAGGWALGGKVPDPDITGMAIQGLTPYYATHPEVRAAVDRALIWLSNAQTANGGYKSWGTENIESTAQVIVALTGMGIDPQSDPRFVKNGKSVLDDLLSFAAPAGGFMHIKPGATGNGGAQAGVVDGMATDQGTYALVAYDRFVNGQTRLYDMTDVQTGAPEVPEQPEQPEQPKDNVVPLPAGDQPKVDIPQDDQDYLIPITASDSSKDITVQIPDGKNAKVSVSLPANQSLPGLEAVKGNVTAQIAKGTQVISGDASSLDLISSLNTADTTLKDKLSGIIANENKLDSIVQAFSMGGDARVEFSQYVTLTFAGMSGKNAAYIQGGTVKAIHKYASDAAGFTSGQSEYAFDRGNDLIVQTKHFTDFVAYAVSSTETPGGGAVIPTPQPKKYATLSVDKLTIGEGYVVPDLKVELQSGDTAWTVLRRVLDDRNIDYDYDWTDKFGSIYVQSIAGGGEFDHGSGSGWMYNVNGWYPNYGASKYVLNDGDRLQWRYTTNLGEDLGEDLSQWEGTLSNGQGNVPVTGGNTNNPVVQVPGTTQGGGSSVNPSDPIKSVDTQIDLMKLYTDASTISSWAYQAIGSATRLGFVEGNNGKFNPQSNITRAEFMKILVSVLGLDIQTDKVIAFTDVNSKDWFYPYVNAAYKEGIATGYNHQFNPNDKITREQMASTLSRALELSPAKPAVAVKDINKVSGWAQGDVETVIALELMLGSDQQFKPKDWVTREMAAVVATRAYDYKQGKQEQAESGSEVKAPTQEKIEAEVKQSIQDTAAFLQKTVTDPVVASVGGEWTVFGLARSGVKIPDEYYAKYYATVEQTLKDKSGKLHRVKYTEYDRVILALTAMGKGIDNVAGYDLRAPLTDYDTVIKQGINGPIFALIALDSHSYEIPVVQDGKTQTTREKLIDFILQREISGGGWALGERPGVSDPDITGMVIQGLTPYYTTDAKVKAAVDRGVEWLSKAQAADGGYASWGSVNSESIAQVIVALTSLGIDPHHDARFIKNGKSPLDALMSYAAAGGGFYHVKAGGVGNGGAKPGEVDLMATDQALYALIAYDRFMNGQPRLYDMTDVK